VIGPATSFTERCGLRPAHKEPHERRQHRIENCTREVKRPRRFTILNVDPMMHVEHHAGRKNRYCGPRRQVNLHWASCLLGPADGSPGGRLDSGKNIEYCILPDHIQMAATGICSAQSRDSIQSLPSGLNYALPVHACCGKPCSRWEVPYYPHGAEPASAYVDMQTLPSSPHP